MPGIQPAKPFPASKIAALQSVTSAARVSKSTGTEPLARAAWHSASNFTAAFVQHAQWPSKPPTIANRTELGLTLPPERAAPIVPERSFWRRIGVERSGGIEYSVTKSETIESSLPV